MKAASINQFLQPFDWLSKREQAETAKKIDKQTIDERWGLIDSKLPDAELPEEDIMNEVRAVRYKP